LTLQEHDSNRLGGAVSSADSVVGEGRRGNFLALTGCDRRVSQEVKRYALEQNWDLSPKMVRNRRLIFHSESYGAWRQA